MTGLAETLSTGEGREAFAGGIALLAEDFFEDATFQNGSFDAGLIHGKLTFDALLTTLTGGEIGAVKFTKLVRKAVKEGPKALARLLKSSIKNSVENIKNTKIPFGKRLPKTKGKFVGERGNSIWESDIDEITGGLGIPFKNGYPDFSKWSKANFKFKKLDGTDKDFDLIYERIRIKKNLPSKNAVKNYLKEKGLTPHHHQDMKTIQLIPTKLHKNIPDAGGASLLRNK